MLHFCEYNLQLISTLLACIFDSLLRFSLLRVVLVTAVRSDPINKRAENNLTSQVKEVGGAFLGKSGTRSDQYSPSKGYVSGSKLKK